LASAQNTCSPSKIQKSAEKRRVEEVDQEIGTVKSSQRGVGMPSRRAQENEAVEKELTQERTSKKAKTRAIKQKKKENKAKAWLNNVLPNWMIGDSSGDI
jgi:hypothetical protein